MEKYVRNISIGYQVCLKKLIRVSGAFNFYFNGVRLKNGFSGLF